MSEEDLNYLSPEELDEKIAELQTNSYYMTSRPDGMVASQNLHDAAVEKMTRLMAVKHPTPEQVIDEHGVDRTPRGTALQKKLSQDYEDYLSEKEGKDEANRQTLEDELRGVTDGLSEINPDVDYEESFDGKHYREKIDAYRTIRLLTDGDLEKAKPEMMRTANAALKASGNTVEGRARVQLLQNFLETATSDPADIDFLAGIVETIYDARIGEN